MSRASLAASADVLSSVIAFIGSPVDLNYPQKRRNVKMRENEVLKYTLLMKRGLTLGKFAPLHKGHQLVIETALTEMDEVLVIIYDAPDTTDIPLNIRSGWLRKLYPQLKVIEAWDGPTEVGDTAEIKKRHEDYIINTLGVKGITHFYSSEFYGDHMSRALKAVNRLVDPDRRKIPTSGSQIRKNPHEFREYLSPIVYRDMVVNVVFLGAPSTGKTTIAERMAQEYHTIWMPEYGREYWEKNQVERKLTLGQLVEIAEVHLEREENLLYQAKDFLFTDTNAITTYMFSQYYHQTAPPRLIDLANQCSARYDLFFLCGTDVPYADTWDRSGDVKRKVFQKQIVGDLLVRKIPFFVLNGDLETRMLQAKAVLSKFRKYQSLSSLFQGGQ